MTHNDKLYYPEGSFRITMMDIRRLLPDYQVKDFNDARAQGLTEIIEKRFNKYIDLGGECDIEPGGSVVGGMEIYPSLFALTSKKILKRVTGRTWKETVELLNQ